MEEEEGLFPGNPRAMVSVCGLAMERDKVEFVGILVPFGGVLLGTGIPLILTSKNTPAYPDRYGIICVAIGGILILSAIRLVIRGITRAVRVQNDEEAPANIALPYYPQPNIQEGPANIVPAAADPQPNIQEGSSSIAPTAADPQPNDQEGSSNVAQVADPQQNQEGSSSMAPAAANPQPNIQEGSSNVAQVADPQQNQEGSSSMAPAAADPQPNDQEGPAKVARAADPQQKQEGSSSMAPADSQQKILTPKP